MAEKETIKVKSVYCEMLGDPVARQIMARIFPVKTSYWISRAFDKIRQEAKAYGEARNKLVTEHTDDEKYEAQKKAKTARPDQVPLKDVNAYNTDLALLHEAELDLGIDKVEVDLEVLEAWLKERGEKDLSVGELEFLLPFFNIK